jgi:hypothetical protein
VLRTSTETGVPAAPIVITTFALPLTRATQKSLGKGGIGISATHANPTDGACWAIAGLAVHKTAAKLATIRIPWLIKLDNPHPMARAFEDIQRLIQFLSRVGRGYDGAHARLVLRYCGKRDARREDAFLE